MNTNEVARIAALVGEPARTAMLLAAGLVAPGLAPGIAAAADPTPQKGGTAVSVAPALSAQPS